MPLLEVVLQVCEIERRKHMANINPTGANFPIAQQAVPGVPEQKLGGAFMDL